MTSARVRSLLISAVFVLALLGFSASAPVEALDSASEPISIGAKHELESRVLGESRRFWIALPDKYATSSERCGVLYLIDGNTLFFQAAGIVRHQRSFLPWIVVGIDNPDNTRTRDLTPPTEVTPIDFPGSEGSRDFRRFLVDELRPFVDSQYRTNSIRLLAGHSFGGLFVIDTMLEEPAAFNGYLALSPSLYWEDGIFGERLSSVAEDHGLFERFAFFSIGDELMNTQFDAATSALAERAPFHFRWRVQHFPGMSHWAVALPSMNAGLNAFVAPVTEAEEGASTLEELVSRFAALSELYGEKLPLRVRSILVAAESLYVRGEPELFVQMIMDGMELMPRETLFYTWLGEGYEEFGFYEEAIALYETGIHAFDGDEELGAFADELKVRAKAAQTKLTLTKSSGLEAPEER